MAKSYEELEGAAGRERFFRPARHDAVRLFAGEPPTLYFEDRPYALRDISGAGSGATTSLNDLDDIIADVNRVGVLRLVQRGQEIFRARARYARADAAKDRVFCGFALESDQFDLADLRRLNALAVARIAPGPVTERSVPSEYKSFCADVVAFVAGYLNVIERKFAPIENALSAAEMDAIAIDLCASASPGWRTLVTQGNDLVIPIQRSKRERLLYKAFTESVITRTLLEGEGWSRTYRKPMGYPGDYRIMNYIYDGEPIGDSIRARFLHLLSLVGAEPVRTRMVRLAELVLESTAKRPPEEPIDILSVGAGPARETELILDAQPKRAWRFTLVDQEGEALEDAVSRFARARRGGTATCRALHVSFKEMLDPSPLTMQFNDKSVIYSSGLVDYLNPLLAQRFVRRLYQFLRPGGSIIIGNVNNKRTGMLWPSEYLVDWTLFFRTREEMEAMAAGVEDARIRVESDELDAIHFLIVEKPA
jgi:SAM-dependent methyltransferase